MYISTLYVCVYVPHELAVAHNKLMRHKDMTSLGFQYLDFAVAKQ